MVRTMIMRGGTSKGLYFVESELPADTDARDALLLELMGSPDPRQIDGLGGAHPLTSKVAVVAPSERADADIEYLFLQLGVDEPMVTDRQNCGNLLAGVAPFALERGMLSAPVGELARVRVYMRNTGQIALATVPLHNGAPRYDGTTAISGVPGTAAAIRLEFELPNGAFPTGEAVESIDGTDVTLVDAGMPVVVLAATALGVTGTETCGELEANDGLRERLERIRLEAGPRMGLGDVGDTTIPKLTLISPPIDGGAATTRTFIPHRCHAAIGVLGAMSVAVACRTFGTVAHGMAHDDGSDVVRLEHPSGHFDTTVVLEDGTAVRAGVIRTTRKIMDGNAFARSS